VLEMVFAFEAAFQWCLRSRSFFDPDGWWAEASMVVVVVVVVSRSDGCDVPV